MAKLISSFIRLAFLGFLLVFIYFNDSLKITFEYPYHAIFDNIFVRLAKISLLLLILIELLRLFYYGIVKNPKAPRLLANVMTLVVPTVAILVFLEIGFMFVAQSHEGGLTKASNIWFERYWPPVNAAGYRDNEHTDTLGKKKVLVIGDSFTAGHGLKSIDDRYANILAKKLGTQKFDVYNLGISGSDTRDEYARFEKSGIKPDMLILQYFPNDIERAAKDNGLLPAASRPYSDVPGYLGFLFRHSYLFNYVYWQLPHNSAATFVDYTQKAYTDPATIRDHLRDLGQFVAVRDKYKIPMYAVMFPFSHNLEKTTGYVRPVVAFFRTHNVAVLTVGDLVKDINPDDRIVGRNDFHASALVNKRVGEALYQRIQADQTAVSDRRFRTDKALLTN